jgi:hypothetical protein
MVKIAMTTIVRIALTFLLEGLLESQSRRAQICMLGMSTVKPLYDKSIRSMNADRLQSFWAQRNKLMWRFGVDNNDITWSGRNAFASNLHQNLAAVYDTGLCVWMLVQWWTLSRFQIADEEGNSGLELTALKLDLGNAPFWQVNAPDYVEHRLVLLTGFVV